MTTSRQQRRAGGVRFELATAADDPEIRRLLRENPMPGRVSISLEREPDASVAASVEGDLHHTIVARDASERLIAMGSVSVRERYINGRPTPIGYLGQLRLDYCCRPRASVIRGGYELFHKLHDSLGVKLYLTSIASDNTVARRLLERGLPGMPTYRPLCEYVTVVLRRVRFLGGRGSRRAGVFAEQEHGSAGASPFQCATRINILLNSPAARLQFAPVWSADELHSLAARGLRSNQFRLIFDADEPIACAAVWDQRRMKQAVVRGYPPLLRRARVALNLIAPLTRLPHLPPIGRPLQHAFVSHLATPADRPELIEPLIESLHSSAHTLGVDCLTIGFDARDPRLNIVRRRFGGREFRTQLYVVHWPDGAAAADALDHERLAAPEVALL